MQFVAMRCDVMRCDAMQSMQSMQCTVMRQILDRLFGAAAGEDSADIAVVIAGDL